MKFTFAKEERLKSKKTIDKLFKEGKGINADPLRGVWMPIAVTEDIRIKFGVTVPKRNFKHAVDRNRIKRQLREAIRLNKHLLTSGSEIKNRPVALMIIYKGKERTSYENITKSVLKIFERLKAER